MTQSILLCNTRIENPDSSLIKRNRDNCMNVRGLKTALGEYTVCPACNKWNTKKDWDKGLEKDGWRIPYNKVKNMVFGISLVISFPLIAFGIRWVIYG